MRDTIMLIAMMIILARCICVIPKLDPKTWVGNKLHFVALAGTYTLLGGGAVGTALHVSFGPLLLLLAVTSWVLFDRRKPR